eukprot:1344800-Amphidinium_carterae.1
MKGERLAHLSIGVHRTVARRWTLFRFVSACPGMSSSQNRATQHVNALKEQKRLQKLGASTVEQAKAEVYLAFPEWWKG